MHAPIHRHALTDTHTHSSKTLLCFLSLKHKHINFLTHTNTNPHKHTLCLMTDCYYDSRPSAEDGAQDVRVFIKTTRMVFLCVDKAI